MEDYKKEEHIKGQHILPDYVKSCGELYVQVWQEWADYDDYIRSHQDRWIEVPNRIFKGTYWIDMVQSPKTINARISHLREHGGYEDIVNKIDKLKKTFFEFKQVKAKLRFKWDRAKFARNKNFLEEHSTELLEMLGSWKMQGEIIKYFFEKYNYKLMADHLNKFYKDHQAKIDVMREEWKEKVQEFDIVHKRGRIEKLAYLLKTQLIKYEAGREYSVVRSKEIRSILEQVKKEIEGDNININVNGSIDINASIMMNQSIQQITRKVNINSFIVGVVAAKRGLNPIKLMEDLTTGFYAAHNGFVGRPKESGGIKYPSELIYDWGAIDEMHKNNEFEEAQVIERDYVTKEGNLKEKLLKILSEKH